MFLYIRWIPDTPSRNITQNNNYLSSTDLVHHGWLQIHKDAPGDVLASGRLGEERVERVVSNPHRVVVRHGAVRVDAVLQAVQLPRNNQR